jgi:hypothetical protein
VGFTDTLTNELDPAVIVITSAGLSFVTPLRVALTNSPTVPVELPEVNVTVFPLVLLRAPKA